MQLNEITIGTFANPATTNPLAVFRRSYSSICAEEAGVPIRVIQEVLARKGRDEPAKARVFSQAQGIFNSRVVMEQNTRSFREQGTAPTCEDTIDAMLDRTAKGEDLPTTIRLPSGGEVGAPRVGPACIVSGLPVHEDTTDVNVDTMHKAEALPTLHRLPNGLSDLEMAVDAQNTTTTTTTTMTTTQLGTYIRICN